MTMGNILKELWNLFVDDGRLAVALVAWVALCGTVLPRVEIAAGMEAPAFFLGCLVILVVNVVRTVRRK